MSFIELLESQFKVGDVVLLRSISSKDLKKPLKQPKVEIIAVEKISSSTFYVVEFEDGDQITVPAAFLVKV